MATIAVHGGAGSGTQAQLEGISDALAAGLAVLRREGDPLAAACAAVVTLEQDGRFNAGRGAVRTSEGEVELDAAVMSGWDRRAGAIAALRLVKHPITVARAVHSSGDAVLLVGDGAQRFAARIECEVAPPEWFVSPATGSEAGTVGAVAVDDRGRCAAATSTGGMKGQPPGRVGDSPLIGCGTYADDRCAISGTGDGEAFIRAVFAYSVARDLRAGLALPAACRAALDDVVGLGGEGGCVAVTHTGEVFIDHTTAVMPAGWATTSDDQRYLSLTHRR
jgi:beta-aspartyl-peptidase (threonine type)